MGSDWRNDGGRISLVGNGRQQKCHQPELHHPLSKVLVTQPLAHAHIGLHFPSMLFKTLSGQPFAG